MGARISIQFKKDEDKSVILFSHWGGEEFAENANEYAKKLAVIKRGKETMPLDRLEPNTVMVDFIRTITKDMEEVEGDLYLAKDEGKGKGDNSDYGHHIIELKKEDD